MSEIAKLLRRAGLDLSAIREILGRSLGDDDPFCAKFVHQLMGQGLNREEAVKLLVHFKSSEKYQYEIDSATILHIMELVETSKVGESPSRLSERPFFLMKACWLYEHAPGFLFYPDGHSPDLDAYILKFAREYEDQFLNHDLQYEDWKPVDNPRKIKAVTFWENKTLDPLIMIDRARQENIAGLELSLDFHPFNYTTLLPEEFNQNKRRQIREACLKSGLSLDIHSPIVGPYAPLPDPKRGRQLFFDPLKCLAIQRETIAFARDVGAGSVVVHLIDGSDPEQWSELFGEARGSQVRVTIENYCQTAARQNSEFFINRIEAIRKGLPEEILRENFGITLDVGHYNIEGEDPLLAAKRIGRYCRANNIFLRLHATDNYGKLLYTPPSFSADVHSSVSGRGINNAAIIKLLRSMGYSFDVIGEQIHPLTGRDIDVVHQAQSVALGDTFEGLVKRGRDKLARIYFETLITRDIAEEEAYLFLAGLEGLSALQEHLVYRKIQDKKYLSVNEAKKISQDFMKMPQTFKKDLVDYLDELLSPVQSESGTIQKSELDLICQNISGALYGTINNEHLIRIFAETRLYGRGEVIFEQETLGQDMFLIKEGNVEVLINNQPVASFGPGEVFGELSLFYNIRRTATVRAAADKTVLGVLNRQGFEALLRQSQPYSYDLIYRLYAILPGRLRNLNEKYKSAVSTLYLALRKEGGKIPQFEHLQEKFRRNDFLFGTLKDEEIKKVFSDGQNFGEEQLIFAEGEKGDKAYYILEGRVRAVSFSAEYEEIVLGEMGPGEIFGEMALIDDHPRSASIVTLSKCRLALTDRNRFHKFTSQRSHLAYRLMGFICLSLFRRILRLDKIYADIKKAFGEEDDPEAVHSRSF